MFYFGSLRVEMHASFNCGSVIYKMISCRGFCAVKHIGNGASCNSHLPLDISVAFYAVLVLSARHFLAIEVSSSDF